MTTTQSTSAMLMPVMILTTPIAQNNENEEELEDKSYSSDHDELGGVPLLNPIEELRITAVVLWTQCGAMQSQEES